VKDEAGNRSFFYGATYNNTLIPEYTQTQAGMYAPSREEAERLLAARKADIDSWAADKYHLMNPLWFRVSDCVSRAGFLVSAPFGIPAVVVGERFFPDKELGKRRTMREIVHEYFEYPYDQPTVNVQGRSETRSALQ
jgi:hypothetical protein